MEMKRAGTLKVSKKTSAAFSLFLLGLRGASVSSTGCCGRREGTESLACNSRRRVPSPRYQGGGANSPPRRRSAAALWSKRIARSSPCRSSPSRCRAPSGTAPTAGPGAPGRQIGRGFIRKGQQQNNKMPWSEQRENCVALKSKKGNGVNFWQKEPQRE